MRRGEVVVVIGPSGSGKSTLCRTINRLETIDEGEITIDGNPLPKEGKALASYAAGATTVVPVGRAMSTPEWNAPGSPA